MFGRTSQMNRIEADLEEFKAALAELRDALNLTPGGLAAVMSVAREAGGDAKRAATAAEAAFVGVQTLAAAATAQPAPPLPAETQAAKPRTGKM